MLSLWLTNAEYCILENVQLMLLKRLEPVPSCTAWTNVIQYKQIFTAGNFREFYPNAKVAKVSCSRNFSVLQYEICQMSAPCSVGGGFSEPGATFGMHFGKMRFVLWPTIRPTVCVSNYSTIIELSFYVCFAWRSEKLKPLTLFSLELRIQR